LLPGVVPAATQTENSFLHLNLPCVLSDDDFGKELAYLVE
jgi:hypothetical protein